MGNYDGWRDFDLAAHNAKRAQPAAAAAPAKSRWSAKPCILTPDGTVYDVAVAKKLKIVGVRCGSHHEATRIKELLLEQKVGLITDLMLQRRFTLSYPAENGPPIVLGDYIADATYMRAGVFVVEDAKGLPGRSPIYQWKKKHFAAQYGFAITEV